MVTHEQEVRTGGKRVCLVVTHVGCPLDGGVRFNVTGHGDLRYKVHGNHDVMVDIPEGVLGEWRMLVFHGNIWKLCAYGTIVE